MECRCSNPYCLLDGNAADDYATQHLSKLWVNQATWTKGFVCPDSGQLWVMDFPQSELHGGGPPRLRVVGDAEWAQLSPTVDGGVVVSRIVLPGTCDAVVLLDPDRRPEAVLPWHPFHNVVRVGPGGEVRWRAELLPQESTARCWTGLHYDGALRVWTYSYECELDPASGRVVRTEFTK